MTTFMNDKCFDFGKLIASSKKDDIGKESWIATIRDLTFETEYDQSVGAWTYELIWSGVGPVKRCKFTPFAFKQFCQKFHCPAGFMLKLPGNIAKANLDFFKLDAKEDDVLLKVKWRPEETDQRGNKTLGFHYLRGLTKPSNPVLENTDLLKAIQDPVAETGMKVWKAHFRDHDFHAKLIYGDTINIGSLQSPDNVNVGVHIANSEVGARPLEINVMVFRLICTNGLIALVDGVPLFRKQSFNVSRDDVTREVRNAFKKIENHKDRIIGMFQDAQSVELKAPYKVISAIGNDFKLDKKEIVAITEEFNRGKATGEYKHNKFGVINAITRAAQAYDAETRYKLESIAGQFMADTKIIDKVNAVMEKKD